MVVAVLHDDAERELHDAIDYLDAERPYYGTLFFDAFTTSIERLLKHPVIGHELRGGLRRWVMRAWHYSIIYSIEPYGIYVVAVAHQSRRTNYWRGRVERT